MKKLGITLAAAGATLALAAPAVQTKFQLQRLQRLRRARVRVEDLGEERALRLFAIGAPTPARAMSPRPVSSVSTATAPEASASDTNEAPCRAAPGSAT